MRSRIERYRERHVIVLRRISGRPGALWANLAEAHCAYDDIRVIQRRGGWRHDPADVKRASAEA